MQWLCQCEDTAIVIKYWKYFLDLEIDACICR